MHVDSLSRRTAFASCAMACSIAFNFPANAQCERDSAQAPLPADNDWYGNTVAISGDFAAAGWYTASFNGERSGAVVMYKRDGLTGAWKEHSTLVPPDNQAGDGFGTRVAMDGEVLVASARWDDDKGENAGSAYVYEYQADQNVWMFSVKILASDSAPADDFGSSIAVADNLLVVGAGNVAGGAQQAYVFRRIDKDVWLEESIFSTDNQNALYAIATATDGESVLVSGYWNPYGSGPTLEWVDVFEPSASGEWSKLQQLWNPSGQEEMGFGWTMAMDQGVALIGCGRGMAGPPNLFWLGAYVFVRDAASGTWRSESRIDAATTPLIVWLARWLALDGDLAVVGTTSPTGGGAGVVSIFRREPNGSGWTRLADVNASGDPVDSHRFGFTVAIDGDRIVTGAPDYDYVSGTTDGPGSVYFIDLADDDCNGNSLCDDLDIASGFSLDRNGNGIPDECETILGDINNDGVVNIDDLLALITAWGPCPPPPAACVADIAPPQGDQVVDIDDLLLLLSNWSA